MKYYILTFFIFLSCLLVICDMSNANEHNENVIILLAQVIHKYQPILDPVVVNKIANAIIVEATKNDFSPYLLTAIMWVESQFKTTAKSSKGAMGLMQVRYLVWKEDPIIKENDINVDNIYWIDININCGARILRKYFDESNGSIVTALNRYHTGENELPKDVKYYEVDYVNKIMIKAYDFADEVRRISIAGVAQ